MRVVDFFWCLDFSLRPEVVDKGILPHLLISYISKNASWQLPENRCWLFPKKQSRITCQTVCPLLRMQHVLLFSEKKKKKSNEDCKVLDILLFLSTDLTFAADASDIRLSSKCLECSFPLGIALLKGVKLRCTDTDRPDTRYNRVMKFCTKTWCYFFTHSLLQSYVRPLY